MKTSGTTTSDVASIAGLPGGPLPKPNLGSSDSFEGSKDIKSNPVVNTVAKKKQPSGSAAERERAASARRNAPTPATHSAVTKQQAGCIVS